MDEINQHSNLQAIKALQAILRGTLLGKISLGTDFHIKYDHNGSGLAIAIYTKTSSFTEDELVFLMGTIEKHGAAGLLISVDPESTKLVIHLDAIY